MSSETEPSPVQFEPLRPASRRRVVLAAIFGPILWLVALVVGAWVFGEGSAIALGLLVAVGPFLVALAVLAVIRAARRRQERRYAGRG